MKVKITTLLCSLFISTSAISETRSHSQLTEAKNYSMNLNSKTPMEASREDYRRGRNNSNEFGMANGVYRSAYDTTPTKLRSAAQRSYTLADQIIEIAKLIDEYVINKDRKKKSSGDRLGRILEGIFENDVIANGSLNYLNKKLVEKAQLMIEAAQYYPSRRSDDILYDVCKSLKKLKWKAYGLSGTVFIPNHGKEKNYKITNFFEVADEIHDIRKADAGC